MLFDIPPLTDLPRHQTELIEELRRYKYTAGLRVALARHRFGIPECDQLRRMAKETFELKKNEKENAPV